MLADTDSPEYLAVQYEYEKNFHQRILAETDFLKRQELYVRAYQDAYDSSHEISPEKMAFGYQDAEGALISHWVQGKIVVDYGCSYGSTTLHLANGARHITGCDILPSVIELARKRLAVEPNLQNKVDFLTINPAEFPFDENSVDTVLASDVIEHLHPDDAAAFVRHVFHSLKPGGSFICITPHRIYGPSDISAHFLPKGSTSSGFHIKEYDYFSLHQLLVEAGFANFVTPVHSPRALRRLPKFARHWFFTDPAFRIKAEKCGWVLGQEWLCRVLGLNRAVFLIGRKP